VYFKFETSLGVMKSSGLPFSKDIFSSCNC